MMAHLVSPQPRVRRLSTWIVLLCFCGAGSSARADFIASNLTSSLGFNSLSGFNLTGPKAVNNTGYAIGVKFTVNAATGMTFDSAQLALTYRGGTNALDVSLMTDAKGLPSGGILETIHLTGISATPGIVTATSTSHSSLASGVTYWLVAAYGAPDTNIAWQFNSLSQSGKAAFRADTINQLGTWTSAASYSDPAFAIFGTPVSVATVDAPPSGILLGLGVGGIYAGRVARRRRPTLALQFS